MLKSPIQKWKHKLFQVVRDSQKNVVRKSIVIGRFIVLISIWANNTPKPQNYALFMLKQDITWVYQGEFPPPSFENVDISRGLSLLCILRLNQVHD